MARVKMIPCVQATDMPEPVLDWLTEREISTHYNHSIACLGDETNVFTDWLRSLDLEPETMKFKDGTVYTSWCVAIIAT